MPPNTPIYNASSEVGVKLDNKWRGIAHKVLLISIVLISSCIIVGTHEGFSKSRPFIRLHSCPSTSFLTPSFNDGDNGDDGDG